ncbi:MAG TPA: hypothetical protein VHC18_04760 [Amycolatopsis sp.]|nr:hypothetical protein [Amycolatopsis sp.]
MTTVARPVPGGWRLTGEKTAISWACKASAAVVYARDPGTTRANGVSSIWRRAAAACRPWGNLAGSNRVSRRRAR